MHAYILCKRPSVWIWPDAHPRAPAARPMWRGASPRLAHHRGTSTPPPRSWTLLAQWPAGAQVQFGRTHPLKPVEPKGWKALPQGGEALPHSGERAQPDHPHGRAAGSTASGARRLPEVCMGAGGTGEWALERTLLPVQSPAKRCAPQGSLCWCMVYALGWVKLPSPGTRVCAPQPCWTEAPPQQQHHVREH